MPLFRFRKKSKPLCVLHIDDSRWVRIPVSVLLRRHFGMRVLEASCGQDGLQLAEAERPDLIILDIIMPQEDGMHTLAKLKANPTTKDIPVLMCTARALARDVNTALKLGAHGYLTKPIEEGILVNRVREILISMGRWSKVEEAGALYPDRSTPLPQDFVIPAESGTALKSDPNQVVSEPRPPQTGPLRNCRLCRGSLSYISQYDAWYCYGCRKYLDFNE
jgi:CheY-like chemotaxis protein